MAPIATVCNNKDSCSSSTSTSNEAQTNGQIINGLVSISSTNGLNGLQQQNSKCFEKRKVL